VPFAITKKLGECRAVGRVLGDADLDPGDGRIDPLCEGDRAIAAGVWQHHGDDVAQIAVTRRSSG
jgi:hypothetical protein